MRESRVNILEKVTQNYLDLRTLSPNHELIRYGIVTESGLVFNPEMKFDERFAVSKKEAKELEELIGRPILEEAVVLKFYEKYNTLLEEAIRNFIYS